jgi:Response regulator containing a CheY-like receiver domain and an HD-GYP domain
MPGTLRNPDTKVMEPISLFLVEDDDDHAGIITRLLKKDNPNLAINRAKDGVEALVFLEQNIEKEKNLPDIILLDLKLPRKDGHEVLERIKQSPVLKAIPVVVLTTSDAESDREKAYKLSVNSYLVKPVEIERFRLLVEDLYHYWCEWNRLPNRKAIH